MLIGSSRASLEHLRPLAYSTLADLVHHMRAKLGMKQVRRRMGTGMGTGMLCSSNPDQALLVWMPVFPRSAEGDARLVVCRDEPWSPV